MSNIWVYVDNKDQALEIPLGIVNISGLRAWVKSNIVEAQRLPLNGFQLSTMSDDNNVSTIQSNLIKLNDFPRNNDGSLFIKVLLPASTSTNNNDPNQPIPFAYSVSRDNTIAERSEEGIIIGSPTVVPRTKSLAFLYNYLTEKRLVLIRSPPFSGKTSTTQLFEDYIINNIPNTYVRRFSFVWRRGGYSFSDRFKFYTGHSLGEFAQLASKNPVYLIFDEIQLAYPNQYELDVAGYSDFWGFIKSLGTDLSPHLYVLMVASYNETVSGRSTPLTINNSLDIGFLLFKQDEFSEYFVQSQQTNQRPSYYLDNSFRNLLWDYTGGHVGLLMRTLSSIDDKFKDQLKYQDLEVARVKEYLLSKEYIDSVKSCRAYVNYSLLSQEEKIIIHNLVLALVQSNSYSPPVDTTIVDGLIKKGIVVIYQHGQSCCLKFSSPILLYLYYNSAFGSPNSLSYQPVDFGDLIHQTLTQMRKSTIESSFFAVRHGIKATKYPYEYLWQLEFYHAITTLVGQNIHISPNIGKCFGGFVDFYVNGDKGWAIELMRDGEPATMKEHLERFLPLTSSNQPGRYYNMIKDGLIKNWYIINFTHKDTPLMDQFWHVKYNPSDLSLFKVLTPCVTIKHFDIPLHK